MPRKIPLHRRIVYALLPVILLLAVVEISLRVKGWPPGPTAAFEHNQPFWTIDAGLKAFPMQHKEEGATFPVSSNADSLRYPLHDREKAEGTWRIMTMGCSTTFGWGVTDEESYPARLEALAKAKGRNVEVINAGQPGYTSFQGAWLWDGVLKDYRPDVVLVGFVVQDARKAAYSDRSQAILQNDARYVKSVLYNLRSYLLLQTLLGKVQIRAKERGQGDEGGEYRVPEKDYIANLQRLIADIQAVGATPVLFGYPLERAGYTQKHRYILQATAEKEGVPHFDPQQQMEEATRTGGPYYFTRDRGHANAAGNALIAQWVLDFLAQNNLLGNGDA